MHYILCKMIPNELINKDDDKIGTLFDATKYISSTLHPSWIWRSSWIVLGGVPRLNLFE